MKVSDTLDSTKKEFTEANMFEFALDYFERFYLSCKETGFVDVLEADKFLSKNIEKFKFNPSDSLPLSDQSKLKPLSEDIAEENRLLKIELSKYESAQVSDDDLIVNHIRYTNDLYGKSKAINFAKWLYEGLLWHNLNSKIAPQTIESLYEIHEKNIE